MNQDEFNGVLKIAKYVIFGLLLITIVFGSFGTIGAGERGIKTRFGAVVATVEQGLYFKTPFIDSVHVMDVKTRTLHFENGELGQLSGASRDLQDVSIGVAVNYHVDPTKVSTIFATYTSTENFENSVIGPMIKTVVKSVTAQYTAEEIVTKRAEINEKISTTLTDQLQSKDAVLEGFAITNFDFSQAFAQAIETKVTAVQNAEAQKNKLEQVKYEAQQTIETAKATAEAQRISSAALAAQGGADYVQLKAIEKWNGILPTSITPNGTVPFINLR